MALIKGKQAAEKAHGAVVLDLGDLAQQAQRMRERAQAEADQILATARDEAEQIKEAACEAGYAAGRDQGFVEGRDAGHAAGLEQGLVERRGELDALASRWCQTIDDWESQRRSMITAARRDLLELACRMAEKIVHRVPHVDPAVVDDQVRAAIEHVSEPCHVTIRIHPDDRPLVERAMPVLAERLGGAQHVTLREDRDVMRGGCDLRHQGGRIDATLDTQLRRLIETLLPEGLSSDGDSA